MSEILRVTHEQTKNKPCWANSHRWENARIDRGKKPCFIHTYALIRVQESVYSVKIERKNQ